MLTRSDWLQENVLEDQNVMLARQLKREPAQKTSAQQQISIPELFKENQMSEEISKYETPASYEQPWKDSCLIDSNNEIHPTEVNITSLSTNSNKSEELQQRLSSIDHLLKTCKMIKLVEIQRKRPKQSEKSNKTVEEVAAKPILILRKSTTFPRVSESQKIENINIVLPPQPSPFFESFDSHRRNLNEDCVSLSTTALISDDAYDNTPSLDKDSMKGHSWINGNNIGKNTTYQYVPRLNTDTIKSFDTNSECRSSKICAASTPQDQTPHDPESTFNRAIMETEKTKRKKQSSSLVSKLKTLFFFKTGVAHVERKPEIEHREKMTIREEQPPAASRFSNIVKVFRRKTAQKRPGVESVNATNAFNKSNVNTHL